MGNAAAQRKCGCLGSAWSAYSARAPCDILDALVHPMQNRDLPDPNQRGQPVRRYSSPSRGVLLHRPGDQAISSTIGLSVHELVAARIEIPGNCALGSLPPIFLIQ
jgi:hypothetical protein